MAKDKNQKTNAMRLLDRQKIEYTIHNYEDTDAIAGVDVAAVLGEDPDKVYKTLVTEGKSGEHYVFIIPVALSLELKKAAKAVGEKSVAMIKAKELLPLTGYIHGGCSPVGMKKQFQTVVDERAKDLDIIFVSGGKVGLQIELTVADLQKAVPLTFAEVAE